MLALDAVEQGQAGHPGLPLEAAAIAYVLWTRYLKYNPANPTWPDRDRFVLSAGHGCALLYTMLHLTGSQTPSKHGLVDPSERGDDRAPAGSVTRRLLGVADPQRAWAGRPPASVAMTGLPPGL